MAAVRITESAKEILTQACGDRAGTAAAPTEMRLVSALLEWWWRQEPLVRAIIVGQLPEEHRSQVAVTLLEAWAMAGQLPGRERKRVEDLAAAVRRALRSGGAAPKRDN